MTTEIVFFYDALNNLLRISLTQIFDKPGNTNELIEKERLMFNITSWTISWTNFLNLRNWHINWWNFRSLQPEFNAFCNLPTITFFVFIASVQPLNFFRSEIQIQWNTLLFLSNLHYYRNDLLKLFILIKL